MTGSRLHTGRYPQITETVDTTDWRGPWRYENGALDRELLPMGYIKDDTTYYYHTDDLGNILQVINSVTGGVVQQTHYYPYGAPFGESTATVLSAKNGSAVSPYKFGGKEEVRVSGYQALDFSARYYYRNLGIFTTPDPCQEDYPRTMPMLYCLANPVNLTDPSGCSTNVVQNSDGTYKVIGGDLSDDDLNIYLCTYDEDGNVIRGEAIGVTPVITSFYNSDANNGAGEWAEGAKISPNDNNGIRLINDIMSKTPSCIKYAFNGYKGRLYDFKVSNYISPDSPNYVARTDHYRGVIMGNCCNGLPLYTSARDLGNIVAGYVAGYNELSWKSCRKFFDTLESIQNKKKSVEGFSSQNAQKYGHIWGTLMKLIRTY